MRLAAIVSLTILAILAASATQTTTAARLDSRPAVVEASGLQAG